MLATAYILRHKDVRTACDGDKESYWGWIAEEIPA